MADEKGMPNADLHELAGRLLLQAGYVAGDKVPAAKVQELLVVMGAHCRPTPRTSETFWVDGLVAVRDKRPYVTLYTGDGPVAQLDIVQARQVASDIAQKAARVEADAALVRFMEFRLQASPNATSALLGDLREFRKELDEESPHAEPRV